MKDTLANIRPLIVILFSAALAAAGACASSGGGDSISSYRKDLGRQLEFTLEEARLKIWNRHGWNQVRRQSEYQNLYWESDWRGLVPESGGTATGPERGRARLIIRGRRVQEQLGSNRVSSDAEGGIYRITLHGEYQVIGGIDGETWRPAPPPEDVVELWDLVYDDMYLEVRTGITRD